MEGYIIVAFLMPIILPLLFKIVLRERLIHFIKFLFISMIVSYINTFIIAPIILMCIVGLIEIFSDSTARAFFGFAPLFSPIIGNLFSLYLMILLYKKLSLAH
jgi:hypothetical protein